jgi:hypothetical protein
VNAWYGMLGLCVAGLPGTAVGQEPVTAVPPDKAAYHLFNPTPRALMRDLSTDRPDTTESPFTVDAGHVQLELSFVDLAFDDTGRVESRALSVSPLLLKVGLTNDIDIALGIDPYTRIRSEDSTTETTTEGFGDTVVRLKFNLCGNDAGDSAFALMPFVKIPTASDGLGNDELEGGLILPYSFALSEGWSLGLMAEADLIRDAANQGYVIDFVHTATVGRGIIGDLSGYVEYAGFYNLNADEDYRAYFDAGLTYGLTSDLQLDAGIRVGLTDAAEDFGLFTGIAWRY